MKTVLTAQWSIDGVRDGLDDIDDAIAAPASVMMDEITLLESVEIISNPIAIIKQRKLRIFQYLLCSNSGTKLKRKRY